MAIDAHVIFRGSPPMFDEDWDDCALSYGRSVRGQARMYLGNTVPKKWPRRADSETYEKYARLPSWHVEEAASLVAGYEPRANTRYFPTNGIPETESAMSDRSENTPPYPGAMNWNALLHGPVGSVLAIYARYKQVPHWGFEGDALFVKPHEFLAFCTQFGIPVPPDLAGRVAIGATSPTCAESGP